MAKFRAVKGVAERVVKCTQDLPLLDEPGARIALDVFREPRSGDVTVYYGALPTGSASFGAGVQEVTVKAGAPPKLPSPDASRTQTLTLTFQVILDAYGRVSVVTPGADPTGG